MVKVSIRDYMPPYTTWMQVELEGGICAGSPDIQQTQNGTNENQDGNTDFTPSIENPDSWD